MLDMEKCKNKILNCLKTTDLAWSWHDLWFYEANIANLIEINELYISKLCISHIHSYKPALAIIV